jgi:peptidoglycan biosynthesis protein MviN/MurJ (putative lipid II flippase)
MSWQDAVNGGFELFGGFMVLLHCAQLYRDKQVRGASWLATFGFAIWGVWNLYYYPHLGQWASFAGGVVIVLANTLWVSMMLYYIRREKNDHVTHLKLHQEWVERVTRETVGPESPSTIP